MQEKRRGFNIDPALGNLSLKVDPFQRKAEKLKRTSIKQTADDYLYI